MMATKSPPCSGVGEFGPADDPPEGTGLGDADVPDPPG